MTFTPEHGSTATSELDHSSSDISDANERERSSCPSSSRASARGRRHLGGRSLTVLGAVAIALVATACFPTTPVEQWVPDLNGDGVISQSEIDAEKAVIVERVVAAVEAHRRNVQLNPVLTCIRRHESDRGAYPHTNGYAAKNSRSTASGAYQFLNSTWRNVSAAAGHPGYATARQAPWYVQDAVAQWVVRNQGTSPWRGSGC